MKNLSDKGLELFKLYVPIEEVRAASLNPYKQKELDEKIVKAKKILCSIRDAAIAETSEHMHKAYKIKLDYQQECLVGAVEFERARCAEEVRKVKGKTLMTRQENDLLERVATAIENKESDNAK
ncbi:hypothetical protein IID24_03285 [Patescibacteria group bacterium]|nr:hypothetical protein [Patescibacteria group bacterium]